MTSAEGQATPPVVLIPSERLSPPRSSPDPELPFIGRAPATQALRAAVDEAARGRGGLLLVRGPHGSGKTRLLREFVDGIARMTESVAQVRVASDPREALPPAQVRAAASHGSAGVSQQVNGGPVTVTIVDDLDLAGNGSLLNLAEIARDARGSTNLIVGTYGTEEDGRDNWRTDASYLARTVAFGTVTLDPWSRAEIATAVDAVFAGCAEESHVEAIEHLSGGSPGDVAEILLKFKRPAGYLPDPVMPERESDVLSVIVADVRERLSRLSRESAAVLNLFALMSLPTGRVESRHLAIVYQEYTPARLRELLDEPIGARLVRRHGPKASLSYEFATDIARDVVLERMSATMQARLHAIIARYYETASPNEVELHVYHRDRALSLSREAGLHYPPQIIDDRGYIGGPSALRLDTHWAGGMPRATDGRVEQPLLGLPLTRREIEVLRLLARGCTNEEIANQLVISPNTVANHVSRILAKTGVLNRTAAAAAAARMGLGLGQGMIDPRL